MNAEKPFKIDNILVDPPHGRVIVNGTEHKLEPRMMDVLVYLAGHAGNVVRREELEQVVWCGRIVGYDALTGTLRKLRKILQDDARDPRIIETIPKKGYRLLAPVHEVEQETGDHSSSLIIGNNKALSRRTLLSAAAIILLAIVTVIYISLQSHQSAQPVQNPLTIAVLPFTNVNDDESQDYFTDGITDDLITELAKNSGLFVIARDSSFVYRNATVDVRQIASKLGVRFILTGSARQGDDKLRLNVQLINAEEGRIVWADNYDSKLSNVFALQDKITDNIITSLAIGMHASALANVDDKPANIEAYDYFLHGRNRFFRFASKQENQKARELYRKAIELDQDYAMAYAMLAWTYAFDAMNGWSVDRKASLQQALMYAKEALAKNDTLPVAYFVTGLVYREFGQYQQAKREAEKALAYDPNYANAYLLLATLLYYTGHAEEGLEKVKLAMRLNPHHPYNYPFHLGQAYFILERYDEAIATFEQGLESNPSSERLHVWLAASYVKANRIEDGRWEAEQVLADNPDFDIEKIKQAFPFTYPDDLERFLLALKQAGLGD